MASGFEQAAASSTEMLEALISNAAPPASPAQTATADPAPVAPVEQAPVETPVAPVATSAPAPQAAAPVHGASDAGRPTDDVPRGAVPYRRFAEVNAKANAAAKETERLRLELEAIKAHQHQPQRQPRSIIDDLLDHAEPEDPRDAAVAKYQARVNELESSFNQFRQDLTLREQEAVIRDELALARQSYPHVPEHAVLRWMASREDADMTAIQAAHELDVMFRGYAGSAQPAPVPTPAPTGAPPPPPSFAQRSQPEPVRKEIKTFSDAEAAALAMMQQH